MADLGRVIGLEDDSGLPKFNGHGGGGEHRTTGGRAWCHECREWCYPYDPCGQERCCANLAVDLLAAAEARGRQQGHTEMIEALRDDKRYQDWLEQDLLRWRADPSADTTYFWPDAHHAPQFARYLEAITKEGDGS